MRSASSSKVCYNIEDYFVKNMTSELNKLREEQNAKEHQQILEALGGLVSKNEFKPVRNVVYGMVGIILTFTIGQLLTSVVNAAASWEAIIAMI